MIGGCSGLGIRKHRQVPVHGVPKSEYAKKAALTMTHALYAKPKRPMTWYRSIRALMQDRP